MHDLKQYLGKKNNHPLKLSKPTISLADTYNSARELFRNQKFSKAIVKFKKLEKKKFKQALVFYYLGECNYYLKRYKQSIKYYKESVRVNDKASYLPTLLLHTAISNDSLKRRDIAKKFYNSLILSFPKSKEAKIARQKLTR